MLFCERNIILWHNIVLYRNKSHIYSMNVTVLAMLQTPHAVEGWGWLGSSRHHRIFLVFLLLCETSYFPGGLPFYILNIGEMRDLVFTQPPQQWVLSLFNIVVFQADTQDNFCIVCRYLTQTKVMDEQGNLIKKMPPQYQAVGKPIKAFS